VWILLHQSLDVLGHGFCVEFEVLRQHSPPVAIASP
jgi:hypothetical protein